MHLQKFKKSFQKCGVWSLALSLSANALLAEDDFLSEEELYGDFDAAPAVVVRDPFESINRVTFKLNDFLYMEVVQPIANGYQKITPDSVERGASNLVKNLGYPVRLAGNLLQGRIKGAWVETERFAVNTTLGVVGIFQAADRFERMQPIQAEDVGQAFGVWGIGEGPYLVLPLFGPSNLRDLFGMVGDRVVNPLQQPYCVIEEFEWKFALDVSRFVVESPRVMDIYTQMKGGALDPYSSMKNAYSQTRRSMIEE